MRATLIKKSLEVGENFFLLSLQYLVFLLLSVSLSLSASTSLAITDVPLISVRSGGFLNSRTLNIGYSFLLENEVTVTGIGKNDANGNALFDDLTAPEIALWNSDTSELIVSALIDENRILRDNVFVAPITPFELPAGRYTLAAQYFDGQEPFLVNAETDSPFATVGNLTGHVGSTSDLTLPPPGRFLGIGPNLLIEQPQIQLSEPSNRAVIQRRDDNTGLVNVGGLFDASTVSSIEVRVVSTNGGSEFTTPWQAVENAGSSFSGQLEVPAGGWYEVQARGLSNSEVTTKNAMAMVGVGEVFVIAGQSNSANHGELPLSPSSDLVAAMDTKGNWRLAVDPQPIATGLNGSPWPEFGDRMVAALDVPIGIVSVGWGGTAVGQWIPDAAGPDPDGPLYHRLLNVLEKLGPNGARAILWHQGETDGRLETSREEYAELLTQLIAASREDAGFDIPWGVAQAAFLPVNTLAAEQEIVAAQLEVIANDSTVFAGPLTDDLLGAAWRYDDIHFNEAGLRLHAQRWVNAVLPLLVPEPSSLHALLIGVCLALGQFRKMRSPPGAPGKHR